MCKILKINKNIKHKYKLLLKNINYYILYIQKMDNNVKLEMKPVPDTIDELSIYSKNNPDKLIVIDFKATWCGPCKAIKPFINYLNENYPNVDFYEIDIQDDDKSTITSNFNISKVPTFIYYKNGELCNSLIGTDKGKIEDLINEYI